MRFRTIAAALLALLSSHALAYDPAKAPRYASPDMYRPNVDRIIANSPGSVLPWSRSEPGAVTRNIFDKLSDRLSIKDFGAICDGTAVDTVGKVDDGPAIQATINACNGCTIEVPVGICKIATPLTGKGGIRFRGQSSVGSNIHATPANGSIFSNAQSGAAMITFPGSSNLISNDATAWSFEAIALQGNNRPVPLISAPENNPGRGSWSARINNTVFDGGRPAISAANAWDWWIDGSSFQRCGDQNASSVGANLAESCIYIFNSSQSYTGAGSNSWRITNSFFDITKARGIVADATGPGIPPTLMMVSGNHFGPTGNESIFGCWSGSTFSGNVSEGSYPGQPIINLFAPGGRGSCGSNQFVGNILNTPGSSTVFAGGGADQFIGNTFQGNPSTGQWIQTSAATYLNVFRANKTVGPAGTPTIPMIATDLGLGNTVVGNYASDNKVANNEEPLRQDGTNYWGQLSPQSGLASYTPTVTCVTGTVTTLGTVVGRYKQVGKLVYFSAKAPITTNGTCAGGLQIGLPVVPNADGAVAGRDAAGGSGLAAAISSGVGTAYVSKYDASYPGYNGAVPTISGWYLGQ